MASYTFPHPIFALGFNQTSAKAQIAATKIAVGSLNDTGPVNDVTVLSLDVVNSAGEGVLKRAAVAPHPYPCTQVGFNPASLTASLNEGQELLATTSDSLRLWDVVDAPEEHSLASKMVLRSTLSSVSAFPSEFPVPLILQCLLPNCLNNAFNVSNILQQQGKADYTAPLTAFSWSSIDPSLILTASTNTTVTLWDIGQGTAVTQLIAHDKEVYDVSWCPPSANTGSSGRDVFASCGADGSVRMFDIRSLEHSTILYEAGPLSPTAASQGAGGQPKDSNSKSHSSPSPLMRLAFDPLNPSALALVHDQSSSALLVDVRVPGVPVAELKAHSAPINGLAWSTGSASDSGSALATVSDDGLVLVWDGASAFTGGRSADLSKSQFNKTPQSTWTNADPMLAYEAGSEINSVAWSGSSKSGTEMVAVSIGRTLRCLNI